MLTLYSWKRRKESKLESIKERTVTRVVRQERRWATPRKCSLHGSSQEVMMEKPRTSPVRHVQILGFRLPHLHCEVHSAYKWLNIRKPRVTFLLQGKLLQNTRKSCGHEYEINMNWSCFFSYSRLSLYLLTQSEFPVNGHFHHSNWISPSGSSWCLESEFSLFPGIPPDLPGHLIRESCHHCCYHCWSEPAHAHVLLLPEPVHLDMCYISVTISNACVNSLTGNRAISVAGCAAQIFLVMCWTSISLHHSLGPQCGHLPAPPVYPTITNPWSVSPWPWFPCSVVPCTQVCTLETHFGCPSVSQTQSTSSSVMSLLCWGSLDLTPSALRSFFLSLLWWIVVVALYLLPCHIFAYFLLCWKFPPTIQAKPFPPAPLISLWCQSSSVLAQVCTWGLQKPLTHSRT